MDTTAVAGTEQDGAEQDADEKYAGQLPGPMAVRMWLRMLSCTMVIEKRLRRRFIEQFDTTLPRFDVMAALDRQHAGISMGELSQMLLVSNGNVTAIVRQLQGDGLVEVEAAEHDRRSLIVTMTKKGRDSFADMAAAHHRWIGTMLAGVPEELQQEMFTLLAKVKTSIAQENAA